jgi:hypothetical protein
MILPIKCWHMESVNCVYFFAADALGKEGDPVAIKLNPDGSADLSSLPEKVRGHLTVFGVPDALHQGVIRPQNGAAFLEALTTASNQAWRFRITPEKLS